MGLIGGIVAGAIGGVIVTRFARQPWIMAIVIAIFAILGYSMIPY